GNFFKVVICLNIPLETYGGLAGTVLDAAGQFPSVAGQEMGHAYGLEHSRIDGSPADYMDPWDIMSTRNRTLEDLNAPFGPSGPFLNAANMDGMGWLDYSRVWSPTYPGKGFIVELRPLSRPDLPGFFAAKIDSYYVEFRVAEKWDNAIGQPVVLVHYFDGTRSYLSRGTSGKTGLKKGDSFEDLSGMHTRIEVIDI